MYTTVSYYFIFNPLVLTQCSYEATKNCLSNKSTSGVHSHKTIPCKSLKKSIIKILKTNVYLLLPFASVSGIFVINVISVLWFSLLLFLYFNSRCAKQFYRLKACTLSTRLWKWTFTTWSDMVPGRWQCRLSFATAWCLISPQWKLKKNIPSKYPHHSI